MDDRKGISITVFADTDDQIVEILEVLSRPLSAFVLQGKSVHISMLSED